MPELPEVKTVVKNLETYLIDKEIINIEIFLDKLIKNESKQMFIKKLKNAKILEVQNLGKFIIFLLSNNKVLVSHLRMEGKYRTSKESQYQKHDHIVFDLGDLKLIYSDTRQFGTFHLFDKDNYLKLAPLNKLAKEPQDINAENLFQKLQRKSIPIKSALLDQTLVLGLGNIYVNEVLWHQKIHPETKSKDITIEELKQILDCSFQIMAKATKLGGTTVHSFKSFNGKNGSYQDHLKVHNRLNFKCPRCKDKIQKIKVGGRGTYLCLTCQPKNYS